MGRMEAFSEFFPILLLEEAVCEYSAAESVQPIVFFSDADYPGSDDEPADKEEIQGISADNAVRAAFYFHRGIGGNAVSVFVPDQRPDQQAAGGFGGDAGLLYE